jgi:ATP-dependent Lon protease
MLAVTQAVPLLPLRDIVVYPRMVIPLFVGREKSVAALKAAIRSNKQIILVAQQDIQEENPSFANLYRVGTIANILQLSELPDGTVKVLIEGVQRGKVIQQVVADPYFLVEIEQLQVQNIPDNLAELVRVMLQQFERYINLNKKIPVELLSSLSGIADPVRLVDTIAAHLPLKLVEKQQILEIVDIGERVEYLVVCITTEIEILEADKKIRDSIEQKIGQDRREEHLRRQLIAIKTELGEDPLNFDNDYEHLRTRIADSNMPKDVKNKAFKELHKLKAMHIMSAEATVLRNYLDCLLGVPWVSGKTAKFSLQKAKKILDREHYGLEKIKERILEYLAVQKRVGRIPGSILCIVGPPGVGKTSLAKSISRAIGRKFVRVALGGVRDEAEIRGHRRTYIGAMPGKIIQKLTKVGVNNPLFLLDEIDKISSDYRGDPASALLEVLDPEQNASFNDHYLDIDYDLSGIMFIATANSLNIPPALLDRMEIIRIAGYTEDEKLSIAQKYLLPKQLEVNGLADTELSVKTGAILGIIRHYTREAGVRSLERNLASLCRKVLRSILEASKTEEPTLINIDTPAALEPYLGVYPYRQGQQIEAEPKLGQVNGLGWTEVGGELLVIEAAHFPGKGKITCTGKLGEVMQESIQTAMAVVRMRSETLGLAADFYEKFDFHVHLPEGATPKDGPSAGIAICTSIVSILTGKPVSQTIAMTGEITLRGKVLAIGGLKEKLLAARRAGITTVLIPEENRADLSDIAKEMYQSMEIVTVKNIEEVLSLAIT